MKNPKNLMLTAGLVLLALSAYSQDISGSWQGALKIQAMQLRLVVNITKTDDGYTSTLDSPDQGAKGIPVTTTSFKNDTLIFSVKNIMAEYVGVLKQDTFAGTFTQMGRQLPLKLARGTVELKRPQEPLKPYPYFEEEVSFQNKSAGITLAGTLTLPKKDGVYPVVVLISGSGPQNRNEELMGHKPFLLLADHLTKNGIGVLRFDDRGVGKSTGDFGKATSQDFATDAEAAVQYLKSRKEINPKKIGLMGHSEGGLIAPMLAARSKDIAFIVLLAGPGVSGEEILVAQQRLILKAMNIDEVMIENNEVMNKGAIDLVKKSNDLVKLKSDLAEYLKSKGLPENNIEAMVNQMATPWMKFFISYDPTVALVKVKCPVLALNGEKDLQVPSQQNLNAIKSSLTKAKNKNVTTKELAGLNHLFQECKTGAPSEYATIEQTFSPVALTDISNWITGVVKK